MELKTPHMAVPINGKVTKILLRDPLVVDDQIAMMERHGRVACHILYSLSDLMRQDEQTILEQMSRALVGHVHLGEMGYKPVGVYNGAIVLYVSGVIGYDEPEIGELMDEDELLEETPYLEEEGDA